MSLVDPSASARTRARILEQAYLSIGRRGLGDITLEDVAAEAGVPLAEVELRFPDPETLLAAAAENFARTWTAEVLQMGVLQRATTPEARLLAVFDVYADYFSRDDSEVGVLMTVLAEAGRAHRSGRPMLLHLEGLRGQLAILAAEAGLVDPDDFALSCHVLIKGALLAVMEGDDAATRRAKRMAQKLIDDHRRTAEVRPDSVRLADGATESEWLVVSESAERAGEPALAILRIEAGGYYCYPNVVGYGRLGPFDTLDEAYAAGLARVAPDIV